MALSPRERRTDELRSMRRLDPAQIIDRYKGITGIPPDGQLPYGVSFDAMIAAIVAYEDETGELRGEDW
jgi:hypothetical protein